MTSITYDDGGLRVRFPGWEASMAGRRELGIPDAAVLSATVAPGWSSEVLGFRSGLVVSGFRKLGVFVHPSGARRLVSMTRGLPLLRLGVDRVITGFDEVLVSTPDADEVARAVRARARR